MVSKNTRPKKKSLFPVASSATSSKVSSLTPEDHLLRQLSLRYFVDKSLSVKEVARKLNTTTKKLKSFFEDDEYRLELSERIERVHGVGTEFMQSQAKISLMHIYEEIRRREVEGELGDIPFRELHKMLVDTQKELRLDTPGAFTSKVGVADLTDLQDRYKKSLSGRIHRHGSKKKKLKNVTPRENLLGIEGSNLDVEPSSQGETQGVG